jgi:hypothetical protein
MRGYCVRCKSVYLYGPVKTMGWIPLYPELVTGEVRYPGPENQGTWRKWYKLTYQLTHLWTATLHRHRANVHSAIRDNLRSWRKEFQIFRVPGLRYKMQSDKQTWYNLAARKINSTHKHFQLSAVKRYIKGTGVHYYNANTSTATHTKSTQMHSTHDCYSEHLVLSVSTCRLKSRHSIYICQEFPSAT